MPNQTGRKSRAITEKQAPVSWRRKEIDPVETSFEETFSEASAKELNTNAAFQNVFSLEYS
jgi:hypothetical protein